MWPRVALNSSLLAFQVLGIWVLDTTPVLKMNFLEVICPISNRLTNNILRSSVHAPQLLFFLQDQDPHVLVLRSHRDRMDENQELFCWIFGHFYLGLREACPEYVGVWGHMDTLYFQGFAVLVSLT